jgi:hypothetical protein
MVDTGELAALTKPTLIGHRRIPGLKLQDDRVIRLLDALIEPGGFVGEWTTRDLNTRIVARHHRAAIVYRLSQLRYDLAKLRAEGLVERLGTSRRYRLTQLGLKLGVLLVKLRRRLLGPLMTLTSTTPRPAASPLHPGGRRFRRSRDCLRSSLGCARPPTRSVNEVLTPSAANG